MYTYCMYLNIQQHIKHWLCWELKEHKTGDRMIHFILISLHLPIFFPFYIRACF